MREYPKARLVLAKGKYYVQVTIPLELRPAFRGRIQLRLSTGTTDLNVAERRFHSKAAEIYDKFDEASRAYDPLTEAANKLSEYLPGNPVWTSNDWEPDRFRDSEREVVAMVYSLLNVDPSGLDPEDMPYLATIRSNAEEQYAEFKEELEKRKAGGIQSARQVSEVAREMHGNRQFERQKTKQDHERAVRKFIEFVGDMPIDKVDRSSALSFIDMLANELAQNTLQRDVGFVRQVFSYAFEKGWIERNPFEGLSLRGKGKAKVRRIPFKRSQLKKLFAMQMKDQDRLCLATLAATGMRLDEVALLEWEDIGVEEGCRFFDLQRLNKVVKNESAARLVPVPKALRLPSNGKGRLFAYRLDSDGKAQNAASKALMKYVKQVRDDPSDSRLTVHSLRHTYKDMLREAEVPEEVQNFLMGHTGTGQGSGYGAGPSLKLKALYVEKLDLTFLDDVM